MDDQTRCAHYRTQRDIIAIKFFCCQTYYPCHQCHDALADHPAQVWPRDRFDEKAILCGACGYELTIHEYLNSSSRCPNCSAEFNPGCASHYSLYFTIPAES
ncbi:MAG: hypothetical protein K6T63_02085 [Alicyclobacillus herbarius]|uniref:CHY zinc finger protein n=1 Tax=Alicyclobacillus herbarius TaxID=122960 RepID=UPI00235713FF|nr:CHY zinc finger protein [Alicyclobacillus herbarius]MCL6631397.1 hypothetical protein [Alicyclobacillus herbarius]